MQIRISYYFPWNERFNFVELWSANSRKISQLCRHLATAALLLFVSIIFVFTQSGGGFESVKDMMSLKTPDSQLFDRSKSPAKM